MDKDGGIHPYNTNKGWDERYRKHGDYAAGTFFHSVRGNELFYKTKCKSLDRCIRLAKKSLAKSAILDAAGGSGRFVDYFLGKGCKSLLVTDFSPVGLKIINDKYPDGQVNTEVFNLTSLSSPWEERFDFVFVMEAIFLLETDNDLAQAVKNLSDSLKGRGIMILSDLFPEQEVKLGNYVTYRPLNLYNRLFRENRLSVIGFVTQTFLFNRSIFGRFQQAAEGMGSFLYYLDQLILSLGIKRKNNSIKYVILRKE
jgi:SAM-dependent methyltransferase